MADSTTEIRYITSSQIQINSFRLINNKYLIKIQLIFLFITGFQVFCLLVIHKMHISSLFINLFRMKKLRTYSFRVK